MRPFYAIPMLWLLACGDIVVEPISSIGTGGGTSIGATSGSTGAGGSGGSTTPTVVYCSEAPTQLAPILTPADLLAELVGRWQTCGTISAFSPIEHGGIEIVADGTWYLLEESGSQLVRAQTIDKKGTWETVSVTPEDRHVNFMPGTGGTYVMGATIGHNPKMLYLDNVGGLEGWYHFVP